MQQAEEDGEVGEALLLQHLPEVELHVGLAANEAAVAQKAQHQPVGDEAPDLLGAVQVFLNEGVRGEAGPTPGRKAAEFLPRADDVHGRRVFVLARPVRDGEGQPVHLVRPAVELQLVAQQAEQWNDPGVPRRGSGGIALSRPFQAAPEGAPIGACVGESGGELRGETAPSVEAEVGGPLAGQVAGRELVKQVGAEHTPFKAYRWERGHA